MTERVQRDARPARDRAARERVPRAGRRGGRAPARRGGAARRDRPAADRARCCRSTGCHARPRRRCATTFAVTLAATKETLEGVRGLARRLRPEVLDELGLVPALRNLCDRIEEGTGLVVRRSLDPDLPALSAGRRARRLPGRAGGADERRAARAGRGGAHGARRARGRGASCVVHDGGIGVREHAAEDSSGGIRGMRERALLIGARLEVVPGPGARHRRQTARADALTADPNPDRRRPHARARRAAPDPRGRGRHRGRGRGRRRRRGRVVRRSSTRSTSRSSTSRCRS